MRKTLLILLGLLICVGLLAGCKGRTYQCEGAATDIRHANAYDRAISNMLAYIEGEGINEPCARVMLFWAYAEKGNFTEAVRWRQAALEMDPRTKDEIDALIIERRFFVRAQNMAIEAMNRRDYQNALDSVYFAMELDENYYLPYYLAAEVYVNLEIDALMADDRAAAKAYAEKAAVYYLDAIQRLHAQWLDPGYYQPVPDRDAKRVYYRGADVLALSEEYDEALEVINLAYERFEDFYEIRIIEADILVRQDHFDDAGVIYEELLPRFREAYETAEGGAKIGAADDYVNLLDKIGVYYITRRNLHPDDLLVAIEHLRTGFEIDPDYAVLVDHLNMVLRQLNFRADDAEWIGQVYNKWEELFVE